VKETECWYVGGDDVNGALHILIQLSSPPRSTSLAAAECLMVSAYPSFPENRPLQQMLDITKFLW